MSSPNTEPSAEIMFCPELRDIIFEYLPPQARSLLMGVEVKLWPIYPGEMELQLTYDPAGSLLLIVATEGIYGPEGKLTGSLVRDCELDSETGEVHDGFAEHMVAPGNVLPLDASLTDLEKDSTCFDANKRDFFLNLFEGL